MKSFLVCKFSIHCSLIYNSTVSTLKEGSQQGHNPGNSGLPKVISGAPSRKFPDC